MFSNKAIIRLSVLFAVLSWAGMVFTDISVVFSTANNIYAEVSQEFPLVMLSLFILSVYIFYKYRIEKAESVNFTDLLWKVFMTGLITTLISLLFRLLVFLLGDTRLSQNVIFLDFIYLSNLGLLSAFLISTFIVWKRLILYQKSKLLLTIWDIFEYTLLISLLHGILHLPFLQGLDIYYIGLLTLLGLFLSANMKWVAYLNFKQKWKGILLILLTLLYLGYFSFTLATASMELGTYTHMYLDFQSIIFITALIIFIFIYALFSLLVILFNLPTSSVFEQKLEEVVNFQRLSQSIQTEQTEERVYEILLESAASAVFADAGWIETTGNAHGPKYYRHSITINEIKNIRQHLQEDNGKSLDKHLAMLKGSKFRSITLFPIYVKSEQIGTLTLLKEVTEGFNKEMRKILDTFTNQAGISIENFRLLSEALENERYKEELKIAKRVQSSLLPTHLDHDNDYTIAAFSAAADEVGGDYYDTYRINDHKIALIISDVSGKGTSAAFHMSQMKGIFHSLSQLDFSPQTFLTKANTSLGRCLDKASFITTSYFVIDSKKQTVEFARAGHCPTLYYNAEKGEAAYFKNKGLGLGILRNDSFSQYIQTNTFPYHDGDILVLYTDGITEARNVSGEEFGYDRLREYIAKTSSNDVKTIQQDLINTLYDFTGTRAIDDDYTTLILKFNNIKKTNT